MRRTLLPIAGLLALAACSTSTKAVNGGAPVLPSDPGGGTASAPPAPVPTTAATASTAAPASSPALVPTPLPAPTTAASPSSSPASTPSASASVSAPASDVPASSSASATSRCHTSQLSYALGSGQGAAGTDFRTVVLTNTSSAVCTIDGYPGLQLVDANKKFLSTTVSRGSLSGRDPGPTLVTVQPGGKASFQLSYGACQDEATCQMSTYLEVTPPDERDYLFEPAMLSVGKGAITVTAVSAGATSPN